MISREVMGASKCAPHIFRRLDKGALPHLSCAPISYKHFPPCDCFPRLHKDFPRLYKDSPRVTSIYLHGKCINPPCAEIYLRENANAPKGALLRAEGSVAARRRERCCAPKGALAFYRISFAFSRSKFALFREYLPRLAL